MLKIPKWFHDAGETVSTMMKERYYGRRSGTHMCARACVSTTSDAGGPIGTRAVKDGEQCIYRGLPRNYLGASRSGRGKPRKVHHKGPSPSFPKAQKRLKKKITLSENPKSNNVFWRTRSILPFARFEIFDVYNCSCFSDY